MSRTRALRPGVEWEFNTFKLSRELSRNAVTRLLVTEAETGGWELDRLRMTEDGTPGAEPVDGLHHAGTTDGVTLVPKTRDSAFYETDLDDLLRREGVESFLLCGVSTESCVVATATEAYARDYAVALVKDATASVRWDLHDQAIDSMREQYRQPTIPAAEAVEAMDRRR